MEPRPRTTVSITTSTKDQSTAALVLGEHLDELDCEYAFIGGFAWHLLGHTRPTQISYRKSCMAIRTLNPQYDIDVLVKTKGIDLLTLREKLTELDGRFAEFIKFYYVKELIGDLRDKQLLDASKGNVQIETLAAGNLGLPTVPEPKMYVEQESGRTIPILHPTILILTKMKRWAGSYESTYHTTVKKCQSDQADLEFMITWLASHDMKIEFELYQGKSKDDLLKYVRTYRRRFQDNYVLMEDLESIIKPEDWALLIEEEVKT